MRRFNSIKIFLGFTVRALNEALVTPIILLGRAYLERHVERANRATRLESPRLVKIWGTSLRRFRNMAYRFCANDQTHAFLAAFPTHWDLDEVMILL